MGGMYNDTRAELLEIDRQGIGEINARISRLEAVLNDRGLEYPTE